MNSKKEIQVGGKWSVKEFELKMDIYQKFRIVFFLFNIDKIKARLKISEMCEGNSFKGNNSGKSYVAATSWK